MKGKKAIVKILKDGNVVIKKDRNGMRFLSSTKGDFVTITVTRYIKNFSRERLPVKVYFEGFKIDNIIQHDVALKSCVYAGKDIPYKIYWVRAFIRKSRRGMKITLHRKPIAKLADKKIVRVLFQKTPDGIVLRRSYDSSRGRKLYASSRNRRTVSHVTEISYPKELEKDFTSMIGIPLEEFNLRPRDFSMNKVEGDLLTSLEKKGMKVFPGTTQTIGDILIEDGGYIEITTADPGGRRSSRHNSTAMMIRGRVFEAEHMSIHRSLKPIFVVLHSSWSRNTNLSKEIEEARKHSVYVFFTNFSGRWSDKIAQNVIMTYKSLPKSNI